MDKKIFNRTILLLTVAIIIGLSALNYIRCASDECATGAVVAYNKSQTAGAVLVILALGAISLSFVLFWEKYKKQKKKRQHNV